MKEIFPRELSSFDQKTLACYPGTKVFRLEQKSARRKNTWVITHPVEGAIGGATIAECFFKLSERIVAKSLAMKPSTLVH